MRVGKANGEDWLRLGEAAAALGVSLNTVRRWSDAGRLTCYRSPGGHRRYRRRDVECLLRIQGDESRLPPVQPSAAHDIALQDVDLTALRPVLGALARIAAEGAGVSACRIVIPASDGEAEVLAAFGHPGVDSIRTEDAPVSLGDLPVVAEVLRTGRRLVVADLAATTLLAPREAEIHLARGEVAVLAVPVRIRGQLDGALELIESRTPRAFGGASIAFAEFMARQAGQLIAGVIGEETEPAGSRAALLDLADERAPRALGDPSGVLRTLAERLCHELAAAAACDILRFDREENALVVVATAAAGESPPLQGLYYPLAGFGEAATVLATGRGIWIDDLIAVSSSANHHAHYEHNAARRAYVAPLRTRDEIVGLLEVFTGDEQQELSGSDLGLVEAAASAAALALSGSGDPALMMRRVTQLDDLILGFGAQASVSDAGALVRSALLALQRRGGLDACALYGVDGGVARPFPEGAGQPIDGGAPWRLEEYPAAARSAMTRSAVIVDSAAAMTPEQAARFLEPRGLAGVVVVPLVYWDRLVGLLELGTAVSAELPKAEELAHVTADLLAHSIGSGDVIARLQRRNRDLALVIEAGLEDTAKLSTSEVLHAVVQRLSELTHAPVTDMYGVEGDTLLALVSYDTGHFDTEWEGVVLLGCPRLWYQQKGQCLCLMAS